MKISFDDMNPTLSGDGVDMRACKGLPHDACPCEHWGTMVAGQMNITTHDGQSFELKAGDAFHLQPGHLPTFPVDTEWLDYSPKSQVEELLQNMGLELP